MIRFDAIILAGGRGSRLGGVDKGALPVGGRALLDRVLSAARDAERVVVVGYGPVPDGVLLTREEPVFGGPAAAVVAGLRALRMPPAPLGSVGPGVSTAAGDVVGRGSSVEPVGSTAAPLVLVLACDLPEARAGVDLLLEVATQYGDAVDGPSEGGIPDARGERTVDGWCLAEEDGRLQWLFGLYRAGALERAAEALGDPTDRSMGRLLGGLDLDAVPAPARVTMDIDTPEDVRRWMT